MFHISIWGGLELCLGEIIPPKPSFGDGTEVCAWNTQGWQLETNMGVKFTQPWNSAAHNCKSSLRKCLLEYESN